VVSSTSDQEKSKFKVLITRNLLRRMVRKSTTAYFFALYPPTSAEAISTWCVDAQLLRADPLVIDAPTFDLSSDDQLKADLRGVRALGFAGKAAIHPKQIAAINQFFTPSLEEISTAKHILEENLKGAGTVDGKMVDEAVARHARHIVAMAQALGIQF
jgi:(S)-citramalyl-CoA lyase